MLKTVQTVYEIKYVSWCEVGVNGWKGETISTIYIIEFKTTIKTYFDVLN